MGNNPITKKKIKVEELSEIEKLLYESYRKIDVDFTFNEVTTLKLKLTDDKFYFHTEFSFLLFFNNSIFTDNINQIYKNFNAKIESFINSQTTIKTNSNKFFNVLLIIDDEIETLKSGSRIDFDGLFTVAFERMEILIMLYIDVTNCHPDYVKEFMKQLCENSLLYKSGRKFDCIYILLPNTDYIVKNSQTISFISIRNDYQLSEEENDLFNLLNFDSFRSFLKCKYPATSSNNQFAKFIKKVKPVSTSTTIYIDFNYEISEFPNENLYQFVSIESLTISCPKNIIYVYINNDFNYNPNFDLFINKIISSFEQATDKFLEIGVYLKIKILLINSLEYKRTEEFFANNLLDFPNKINYNNTKTTENKNKFKFKELEMKVNELICKKFKKKNEGIPKNSNLIIQFNEIMGDEDRKEPKQNKYRKTTMTYKFTEPKPKNIKRNEYQNLIIALAKKNYINKLFSKENIKENKINLKLIEFLGIKNKGDKEISNGTIKENYENGLEVEIVYEEKEELVKTFETQFLKSI